MGYNMSFMNTSSNVLDIFTGANAMVDGLYAASFLLVLFIIVFIVSKMRSDTDISVLAASFITSVVAIPFFIMEWIGVEILVVPIVILVIAVFYAIVNGG